MRSEKLEVELWNLSIPLAPHIHSPKGPITATYLLFAFMTDDEGLRGVGYSSFRRPADLDLSTSIARGLVSDSGLNLPALINVERLEEESSFQSSSCSKAAANALSLAAWDLAGHRSKSPCADLWGRSPHRDSLECYASALWLDKSVDQLIAEAKDHRKNNYRFVKMRVGRSIKDNLERIAAVQKVYQEPGTIALETGFDWTAEITNQFLKEAPGEYLWIEDPESYDKIGQIEKNPRNTVAAGEKCSSVKELFELYLSGGVRNLIIDVQRMGGPVRFLEAARALNALGATVGAHRFSHYSMHLLATLPRSLPIEMLDWTNPAFSPLAAPDASGRLSVRGPGFCISLDKAVINRYGLKV